MKILKDSGITAPKGFKAAGIHCGIKKKKKDLAIITSDKEALCCACFTQNTVKAAPLKICEENLKSSNNQIKAIIINSGNANACTGDRGYQDAKLMTKTLAKCLNIDVNKTLVSSTGVIGVYLPIENILDGIENIVKEISAETKNAKDCAQAIMTTDTFVKEIAVEIKLKDETIVKIGGISKGSGMIHPNMATMLGFITTDCNISKKLLEKAFKECINSSFNMISVDGETSTNDMAVIMANGEALNNKIEKEGEDYKTFKTALMFVCTSLAKMIVKDGEGATKFLEVNIKNAKNKNEAKVLCKSIINSNLVKTAFFGCDANWGRILSAMGSTGVEFDQNKISISFCNKSGDIVLFQNGEPLNFDEKLALKILKEKEIIIDVNLNQGNEQAIQGWGCDLSYEYVKINADYRT